MPHSALQAGQYSKWRTGRWPGGKGPGVRVDFTLAKAWDLERLEPNTFFPVPSSVVFARRLAPESAERPLAGEVERWTRRGPARRTCGGRRKRAITDTGVDWEIRPTRRRSRNGATIFPRAFCSSSTRPTTRQLRRRHGQSRSIPRRGVYDKAPWKALDVTEIIGQTVEDRHLFDVHLGETVAPYVTLEPLKALLPVKTRGRGDAIR